MQLTPHFKSEEFECPCCEVEKVDPRLVAALETLRCMIGHPVVVDSGYRCARHNAAVGGVPSSQHLLGTAADIHVAGMRGIELYRLAVRLSDFRGLGVGAFYLHVDVRQGPAAKWTYDEKGRVTPWPEGLS